MWLKFVLSYENVRFMNEECLETISSIKENVEVLVEARWHILLFGFVYILVFEPNEGGSC